MPQEMPEEFRSEEELTDWFESADLAAFALERAAVVVASHVELSVEPPVETPHSVGQTGTLTRYEPVG